MDCCWVVAGQLPNGTLGIRRLTGNINHGGSYVLTGFKNGLYIYQNSSASHELGMALVNHDGATFVLREISHFKTTEASGVLYMKKTSDTDMTIYNNHPTVQGFTVLYIGINV